MKSLKNLSHLCLKEVLKWLELGAPADLLAKFSGALLYDNASLWGFLTCVLTSTKRMVHRTSRVQAPRQSPPLALLVWREGRLERRLLRTGGSFEMGASLA